MGTCRIGALGGELGAPTFCHYDTRLQRYGVQTPVYGLRYFAWDGMNLLMEKDTGGITKKAYTHGQTPIDGIRSEVVANDSVYGFQYPTYDHRGTVQEVGDDAEVEQNTYEHNAFGEELQRTEAETNRFTYQSNWYIARSGDGAQAYLQSRTRDYDRDSGIFVQRDPLKALVTREISTPGSARGFWEHSGLSPMWTALRKTSGRPAYEDVGVAVGMLARLGGMIRWARRRAMESEVGPLSSGLGLALAGARSEAAAIAGGMWSKVFDSLSGSQYAYVSGSPVDWIDPTGLDWVDCLGCCIEEHSLSNMMAGPTSLPEGTASAATTAKGAAALEHLGKTAQGSKAFGRMAPGRLPSAIKSGTRGARVASKASDVATILEGIYTWGIIAACAAVCGVDPEWHRKNLSIWDAWLEGMKKLPDLLPNLPERVNPPRGWGEAMNEIDDARDFIEGRERESGDLPYAPSRDHEGLLLLNLSRQAADAARYGP